MGFSGKVIKCVNCGNEFNIVSFQSHYKKYHSNMNDIELSELHHLNYPKINYLGIEFINYVFKNEIVKSFKEFYSLNLGQFNNFISLIKEYKVINEIDIDTYFNFYIPYKKMHPKAVNSFELCLAIYRNDESKAKEFYDKIIKPRNPYTGHDGKLSPWSKDFVSYKNLSDEDKNKERRKHIFCKDNPKYKEFEEYSNTTSLDYYLNKGYDEDTAKKMLKERQATFSLEKCIKKYGEEEGIKRFKERQKKWLSSFKKHGYSKISQELFWYIFEKIKDKGYSCFFATNNKGLHDEMHIHEYKVEIKLSYVKLDFYIPELKKWIEFDGDYWHGEKRGNQQRDKLREESIFNAIPNIQLKRVQEREYRNDPDKIINECVEWILS